PPNWANQSNTRRVSAQRGVRSTTHAEYRRAVRLDVAKTLEFQGNAATRGAMRVEVVRNHPLVWGGGGFQARPGDQHWERLSAQRLNAGERRDSNRRGRQGRTPGG